MRIPWTSIARYMLASIAMAIPVYMLRPKVVYVEVLPLLRSIAPPILSGASVYFAALYLLDPWFRRLLSRLIFMVTRRFS